MGSNPTHPPHRTTNVTPLDEPFKESIFEFEKVAKKAESMNEGELAYELIEIAKNQVGTFLYLKLLHLQGVFDESQTTLGLTLNYMFSELTQNVYLEVVKE